MMFNWTSTRRWLWRAVKAAGAIAVVGGVLYWFNLSPIAVTQHVAERGPIVHEVLGTGTLEARVKTTVSPKISGRVKSVLVDQGDRVEPGDVLVRLDDDELRQQVAISEANLEAASAALVRLAADQDRSEAVAAQASKHHARIVALAEKSVSSQEDLDKAIEGLAISEAGLSRAQAAIAEGQTARLAAEKTLDYHRARLADTEIVAPFAGLVVRRHRDPGDVVVPGTAILTLISTDELWISAWVDETEMARLHPDQAARVVFRSEPEREYAGQVVRLGREADRETREFIVDVRVLELPKNWAVGQRAEAYIDSARQADALIVPAPYVALAGNEVGVFVNEAGIARWRPVELGLRGREMIEIVQGLQAGDTLVRPVDARTPLTDGRRVSVR
jgi:HlyD family secretion protein